MTSTSSGNHTPLLYTAEQAVELLQVRPSWLRRKATARAIPCTFVGKHLRFSADDLAVIVAAGARTAGDQRQQRSTTHERGRA